MIYKIYIDPGHGGSDPGAVNGYRKEKDDVFKLAALISEKLSSIRAFNVTLSRVGDSPAPKLNDRIAEANKWNADYYLSLHRNSASSKQATGNETWIYSSADDKTTTIAKKILDGVCSVDGLTNRGVKRGAVSYKDFAVNRDTKMPSTLLELGFISNDEDNKIFDKHVDEYAESIVDSLCEVFEVDRNSKWTEKQWYRVRKTWDDPKSQLGAFEILDNAKSKADENPNYSVFDNDGLKIYPENSKTPYLVRVNTSRLNIRKGPGTNTQVVGQTGKGTFTIVEEATGVGSSRGWGLLKSYTNKRNGWIALDHTTEIKR